MRPSILAAMVTIVAAAMLSACDGDSNISFSGNSQPALGGPIMGLSQAELDAFERGKEVFTRRFKPSEGLGPRYNTTSCKSCHEIPVVGGSAPTYRNFFLVAAGSLGNQGPISPAPSVAFPSYGSSFSSTFTLTDSRMTIPSTFFGSPVIASQRNALPLFGVGLFEFVSDATIMSNADPEDSDGDGVSGRFNTIFGSMGRFGVKCQSNNIEAFVRAPLNNQMGITSLPFLGSAGVVSLSSATLLQAAGSPDSITADNDGIPDPEISAQDLGDLIAFTRFLAPPEPRPFTNAALRGETLFTNIGCAKCHIPTLMSSRGPLNAYTDLLIHDMGAGLADNITQGTPQTSTLGNPHTASEFRTQPLWGFSQHAPFLHDGRADTIEDAIHFHGGEADGARALYVGLSSMQQSDLIAFLESL